MRSLPSWVPLAAALVLLLLRPVPALAAGASEAPEAPDASSDAEGEAEARRFFLPRRPLVFSSLSIGAGVIGDGLKTDAKGNVSGNGGVFNVAARVDLEALSPFWASAEARLFVGAPLEYKLDAEVGYEALWFHRGGKELDRIQLRPLGGVTFLQFADSPIVPTTAEAEALRAGVDWALLMDTTKGGRVWRGHAVMLGWDLARNGPGFEVETSAGLPFVQRAMAGVFLGVGAGYLPSSKEFFHVDLGGAWEVGR